MSCVECSNPDKLFMSLRCFFRFTSSVSNRAEKRKQESINHWLFFWAVLFKSFLFPSVFLASGIFSDCLNLPLWSKLDLTHYWSTATQTHKPDLFQHNWLKPVWSCCSRQTNIHNNEGRKTGHMFFFFFFFLLMSSVT